MRCEAGFAAEGAHGLGLHAAVRGSPAFDGQRDSGGQCGRDCRRARQAIWRVLDDYVSQAVDRLDLSEVEQIRGGRDVGASGPRLHQPVRGAWPAAKWSMSRNARTLRRWAPSWRFGGARRQTSQHYRRLDRHGGPTGSGLSCIAISAPPRSVFYTLRHPMRSNDRNRPDIA
jgi:hypothetical protein